MARAYVWNRKEPKAMLRLLPELIIFTALAGSLANAQTIYTATEDTTAPSSDYILASGMPGCASNPFDWVQAAAKVVSADEEYGVYGALVAVLDGIGRSGKVGGWVGELLELFYGPRYASCAPVSVVIPAEATIVSVVYRARDGVAGEQGCHLDGNGWNICDIGWSRFEPLQITPAGNSKIVTSIFANWSSDRERGATLTVNFTMPVVRQAWDGIQDF